MGPPRRHLAPGRPAAQRPAPDLACRPAPPWKKKSSASTS
jgi:hypothetical protein